MKIKNIKVENFKAISQQEMEFNGASAIITGGNNRGKSSFLRGLIDRFRNEKPEIIVKEGEEKGFNTMELMDGSIISWSFTKKNSNFSFTTADGIKMTTGVLSAIGEKYFGTKFDIDKFLTGGKANAKKMAENLLGVDLSDLEEERKVEYDKRTEVNKEIKRLRALEKSKPEVVASINLDKIREEKAAITKENEDLKSKWTIDNEAHQKENLDFNNEQIKRNNDIVSLSNAKSELQKYSGTIVSSYIDFSGIEMKLQELPEAEEEKEITSLDEPGYKTFVDIDKKIEDAIANNSKVESYEEKLLEYNNWVNEGKTQRKIADELNAAIEAIDAKKAKRLADANIPKDFEITEDGILYKGLPLDNNQLSTSAKYICALKLGSLVLGKVRAIHFDASALDKNSMQEVYDWAVENDMQLLVERPDWNDGEVKYEIIEK